MIIFLLVLIIDQQGTITTANIGVEAEVKQLENILEDLKDRWFLVDLGYRSKKIHKRFWEEKQIAINLEVQAPLPLSGDRDLLFQAFANLLDNAIKYTPEDGAILIRSSGRHGELCVEVADTGVGIAREDRDKVFRRFYRVESSRSIQPGNGLGLSLVQAVVNLHRGNIALADNAPGLKVAVRLPGSV